MVLFAAKSMFFSDLFNWTLDVERWALSVFSLHHKRSWPAVVPRVRDEGGYDALAQPL